MIGMNRVYVAAAISFLAVTMANAEAKFSGAFEFRWLADPGKRHRNMQLLSDVSFTDNAGLIWAVPANAIIDGASIPSILWTYAGSPFVGNYRRASVIHDHFCDTSSSGGNDIHKMFKEAMIVDGVGFAEAWSKYLAVLSYGNSPFGKCGNRTAPLEMYQEGFLREEFPLPDESLALFARIQAEVNAGELVGERDRERFLEYANAILDIAGIKAGLVYRSAVEYRLMPSLETLNDVEVAIAEEQLGEPEIEQAMLLAVATVPEPSN